MNKSERARAAAVSRALRAGGLRPLPSGTPRSREGVRVSPSVFETVSVVVSIDAPRQCARVAADVEEVLADAGYTVETQARGDDSGGIYLYRVSRADQ